MRPWLKPDEAAALLQTDKRTIYEMARKGEIRKQHVYWVTPHQLRVSPDAFGAPEPTVNLDPDVIQALSRLGDYWRHIRPAIAAYLNDERRNR